MIKCPKCGVNLNENQKFCKKCGTKIEKGKKSNLSPEILAKIDILQKKISNENLNNLLYIELGDIFFENEMYNEAILEYQKAFAIDNTNFDSIYKTAETYRKINNNSKAEHLYKKALEIEPESQVAKIGLFWSLLNLEKNDELFKIEKDISNEFKDINIHIALKDIYKKTDKLVNALQEMEIIYKLKSDEPGNLHDLADYYYISDYDKSIDYYQQLFAVFPEDSKVRFELGKYYYYINEYNKTIELLDDSISSLQSDNFRIANYYLANAYLHLNFIDKAKNKIGVLDFTNLKNTSQKDKRIISEAYFMLCDHSLKLKNYSEALKYIKNAIYFEPENAIYSSKEKEITVTWNTESKKSRKKKAKKNRITMVLLISIIIIVIAGIKLVNIRQDNSSWILVKKENSINSYKKYLSDFPNGIHEEEAKKLFEESIWLRSKKENNVEAFKTYLKEYPNGNFIQEAKENIESQIWENAKSQNTIESYSLYLSKYPNGKFENDATIFYKELFLKNYVLVYGDSFKMGNNDGEEDEKPVHRVTLKDFYIGKYEVTQEKYQKVMGENPSRFTSPGKNAPVDRVSWYDAVEFCNKLSEKEGLIKCYSGSGYNIKCNFSANGYRLPTEAEWEYAAKGGNKSKNYKYSGSNDVGQVAWNRDNSGRMFHSVGGKNANELGIYDMSGNVCEWCWDYKGAYSSSAQTEPHGPLTGSRPVLRGGSWKRNAWYCRVTFRYPSNLHMNYLSYGFRLVRSSN